MANANAIRAGRAFVELYADDTPFLQGLRRAESGLNQFAGQVGQIGQVVFAAGAAIAAPLLATIAPASDAQETLNRFRAVFGDQADAAEDFAQRMSSSVNRSVTEMRDGLASFQGLFGGLGLGASEARQLSEQMQALAIDFASFNNLTDADAQERFLAGLSGSSEVFAKYGINLKQAALDQQLLSQGHSGGAAKASELEKVLARVAIITQTMTQQGAAGDAARTADQLANAWRGLTSQATGLAEAVGGALIPMVEPLVANLAGVVQSAVEWASQNQAIIQNLAVVGTSVAAVGAGLLAMSGTIKVVAIALGAMRAAAQAAAASQAFLLALSGPAGWANVAVAVGVSTAAILAMNAGLEETAAAADGAAEQLQKMSDGNDQVDTSTRRVIGSVRVYNRLIQEQRDALRAGSAAHAKYQTDAQKLQATLEELQQLRESGAITGTSQRAFQVAAIDQATGVFTQIQDTQDQIRLLSGQVTEQQLAAEKLVERGVPESVVARLQQLQSEREQLQKRADALAARERSDAAQDAAFYSEMRAEAERVRDALATPGDNLKADIRQLERLRDIVDPETGRSLLSVDEFTGALQQRLAAFKNEQFDIDASGTFSARVAEQLGGVGSLQQRQTKAAERAAQLLEDIKRNTKQRPRWK